MTPRRSALVLATLLALPAFAEEPPASPTPAPKAATQAPKKAAKKVAPAGSQNMIVTKDPETGELRPATAAEREKLLGRKPLVAPERRVVTLPDGSLMVELGDADMSYAVVRKNPDGTLTQGCVHGDANATKATSVAPSSSPASAPADR